MPLHHPPREQLRLEDVLTALGHPVRLSIVRTLAQHGECKCSAVPVQVSKSTATHHWRVLRESGVIRQVQSGRAMLTSLRRADLEARFPGLLTCVLSIEAEPGPEPGPASDLGAVLGVPDREGGQEPGQGGIPAGVAQGVPAQRHDGACIAH